VPAEVANLVTFRRYGPCVLLAMSTRLTSVDCATRDQQLAVPGRAVAGADDNPLPVRAV